MRIRIAQRGRRLARCRRRDGLPGMVVVERVRQLRDPRRVRRAAQRGRFVFKRAGLRQLGFRRRVLGCRCSAVVMIPADLDTIENPNRILGEDGERGVEGDSMTRSPCG